MLLNERKIKELPIFTPTKWQTVLLRNYGLVSSERLARVLKTDVETLEREAKRLGLDGISYNEKWLQQGYVTVIRNNWHLLSYSQLTALLGMTAERLDFHLREDDFLAFKLGGFKPVCDEVAYAPLTEEETRKTEEIAKIVRENFIENYVQPFHFGYEKQPSVVSQDKNTQFEKIVYAYSAIYGDPFLSDGEIVSETLLKRLSQTGVNGIWFQGVLSKLSPYPFVQGVSDGYEKRRENLQKLIDKCAEYGIKVYLYFNEPRALEEGEFTEETRRLQGRKRKTKISLCTSKKEVQAYLYEAVKELVQFAKGLGGVIAITACENLTNCYSWPFGDCPICSKRSRAEVVAEVNNIMARAVKDSNTGAKYVANLWGWSANMGWTKDEILYGISLLDKDIAVMCVSEYGTVLKDGISCNVAEYSLSQVGPCEEAKEYLAYAKARGHKIMSKVQINNSWELSVVPYIPVFDLIIEHMENLKGLGVSGLMLSWTLGGYPSASFRLVNEIFSGDFCYDKWLEEQYAENWDCVKKSVEIFSNAFRYYPFSQSTVYYGAAQMGASNLWYPEKTELKATMVCFPYDDLESWCGALSTETFQEKMQRLTDEWLTGLNVLMQKQGNEAYEELKSLAQVVYLQLKSFLLQVIFNANKPLQNRQELLPLIQEEWRLTKELYALSAVDARIGYEASNHYYFTQNTFLEKLINLTSLIKS